MDLEHSKSVLYDVIDKLSVAEYVKRDESFAKLLNGLISDMEKDFYMIVVVGEFKRGKSTFINALLGEALLPMDVLPETATINALMYSEKPQIAVVWADGREEHGEPSYDFLSRFSAQQKDSHSERVKYIKIGYPMELLKNRIVLVDTPGVSDLNEQRCDVTYNFLPQANAVLFLLDASAPLKKTEKDFIENRLLPLGINNIVFVANKVDCLDDEEDDFDDAMADIHQRLLNAFKMDTDEAMLRDITLYPISAKMALEGQQKNDMRLIEASGILVERKINNYTD